MGYKRAGFDEIVGVDSAPQPHYPFAFVQGDALKYVREHGRRFHVIHASPPCQGYSRMRHLKWLRGRSYPKLIGVTRAALQETQCVWVIENVVDAPLNGAVLCGAALGLPIIRHRRFESNLLLLFPPCPGHSVYMSGHATMSKRYGGHGVAGVAPMKTKEAAAILGIDWMTGRELRQAIPPAFTEYIGKQLIAVLEKESPRTSANNRMPK